MNPVWRLALGGLVLTTPSEPVDSARAPTALTVYAAASLTEAFRELGRTLEQRHPGLSVQFNFAGSQQLALQLEQGATADLFASADQRWMAYAKQKGLIEGDAVVFAHNRLIVVVPRPNPARIGRLQDLARRGVKLVIAAEAVPVGKYSREVIGKLAGAPGFPPDYEARVLANVVSQEENAKGVVAKVQLGEADAGVVYRSDVTSAVSRYLRVFEIPETFNVVAAYPMALLRVARNPEAARLFLDVATSDEGQRMLEKHGLLPASQTAATHP